MPFLSPTSGGVHENQGHIFYCISGDFYVLKLLTDFLYLTSYPKSFLLCNFFKKSLNLTTLAPKEKNGLLLLEIIGGGMSWGSLC